MKKRLLCLLLAAVMIVGMMPAVGVFAQETETLSFVEKSSHTGGDWVGKYGADGYFLPFYTLYEKYNPLIQGNDAAWYLSGGRYRPKDWTRYTLEDGVSLKNLPSYVTNVSEVATGDGYQLDDAKGFFKPGNEPLAPQDPRAEATTRNKAYVRSSSNMSYKFTLNDTEWHDVTVYATSYNYKSTATYSIIEGTNEGGTKVATCTITEDEAKVGVYMTFRVKGNFVLRVDKISGDTAMINGIFFDAKPAEESPEGTAFVGKGEISGGDWVGKYGAEGYFLPFYTLCEKYEPLVNTENSAWFITGGRYRPVAGAAGSTRNTLEDGVSLKALPSYVTNVSEVATGDGYQLDDTQGFFMPGNELRAPQDPREGATTRNKNYVRSGSYMAYKFTMNDDAWHYVTVYAVDYAGKYPATYSVIEGTSEGGTPSASYAVTADELNAGVYLTFKVKGNFVLHAKYDNTTTSGYCYINGIFFDAVPAGGSGEGGEPVTPPAPTVPGMLRIDTATKGDWKDHYGLDSAILFGYKFDAKNANATGRTSVNKDDFNLMVDAIETPYYSHFYLYLGGNLSGYLAQAGDASVLTMPNVTDAGGTAFNVYATNGVAYKDASAVDGLDAAKYYGQITITPTDTNPHILTLYSNMAQGEAVHVRIVDELENLLAEDTIPAGSLTGGGYVSFPLQAKTADKKVYIYFGANGTKSVGFNALFLDTLQNVASNLAVEGEAGDGAKLTWTNGAASAGCQTQIQRSEDNGATWRTIAAVSGTTYTDPGLTPGKTYTYRVSTVFGTMESGVYTNTVSYTAEEHIDPSIPVEHLSFVAKSAFTGGDWVGKVGAEGYFLPFYRVYEVFHPLTEGENATYMYNDKNKYEPVASNPTGSPNRLTLLEDVSLASWPSYMGTVVEFGTQNGYVVEASKGNFLPGHEITAPQDPREGMTTRNKTYVRANPGLGFKFNFTDDEWHYMTVYAATYNYQSVTTYSVIEGTNESAAPVASYTATREELKAGVYMTFKVKGSFVLKATMADGSDAAFINGIFFDAIPNTSDVSGLQAAQTKDGVTLNWSYSGTDSVTVQRRVTGTEDWQTLGNTAAGATSFMDRTVETGVSYDYRVAAFKGILPTVFTDSVTIAVTIEILPPFAYVGRGSAVGGNWIGKVGAEGYFLPFYTIYGAFGEIASGRYDSSTGCTGLSLQEGVSLIKLPADVAITGEDATHNGYYIGDKDFRQTTDARAPQDPRDNGATRSHTYVRSQSRFTYTFDMPEDKAYYVTVYTTDYGSDTAAETNLLIQNTAGTETLARAVVTVDDYKQGVYSIFKVTGDFKLRVEAASNYVFVSGIYFDQVPEWEANNFKAENGPEVRDVTLSWSSDKAMAVERKGASSDTWEQIAVVDAGVNRYVDTQLWTSVVYTYRVRPTNGILLGAYTEEKSVTLPDYVETSLTVAAQSYTVEVGQTLRITGQLKKADSTPIAGKVVNLIMAGLLVDEGFVSADMGTVTTDAEGNFTAALEDIPCGSYELTLYFAPDDANALRQSIAIASIEIEPIAWDAAPVLLTVSDGVAPGEYFSINGYGFNIGDPEVRIGTGAVEGATALTIAQYDETDGYFIQVQLPKTMAAGTYKIWVKNDKGWSKPILFNGARPLFISENSAWVGQIIEISGRNLLGSQYGAADATAVRLVGTAGTYVQTITENNPYKIAFAVKDAPAGDYTVEVTNDGVNWAPLSSGQILSVVAAGKDPLGLGVAWADVYKWDNRISVLDHGATGNDTSDDTAAIQAAVDAAAVNGGVVYLPAGSYYVSRIAVPAHVVIMGEGMDKTYLYYNGTDGKYMIESVGTGADVGYQGFAQFTIRLADANYQPDTYFWIGYPWGGNTLDNKYARENKYYFLYEVGIDTDPVLEGSNRGLGVVPIVGEHFLMQSCRFVGDMAIPSSGYVTAYAAMKDCYLEFAQGAPQLNSSYTFIEDTDVIIHYETGRDSHGIVVRDNSHVEDCYVYGAGGGNKNNDGETILAEATSWYDFGKVVSVEGNKILLDGTLTNLTDFKLRWGDVAIMITDGKGIGQYRYIDMSKFNWSNPDATEVYVTEPWDIEPDATSAYTLVAMIENVTFYRNKTEDGVKGIWFYGNVNDGVIAENTSINTEGIFAYSSHNKSTSRHTVSYRTTIRDNELYGVARQSNRVGIFTHAQRHNVQGEYAAVSVYALDVKDNRIYGDPTKSPVSMNETPRHSGIVISSCEISSDSNCLSELGQADTANVIIQGNQLFNLKEGILATSCTYGTVIANNYFEDVETKLVKLAVDTAKVAQPLMLQSDISDDSQTQPECTDHLWVEGENGQVCCWCGQGRVAYIGDKNYESLAAALAAAKAGDVVYLAGDAQAEGVLVKERITLDLNGHDLTTTYLVAFVNGEVRDSIGGGLLKCEKVRLEANNDQMPVWDSEARGYRFFTMLDSQKYRSQSENNFVFISKPVLGKVANDAYMAMKGNGLTVKAKMTWQSGSENDVEQLFVLKTGDVQTIYSTNKVIKLSVSGTANYVGRLSTTMVIESDTGVIWEADPLLYIGEQA